MVFRSSSAAVFIVDLSRSAKVIEIFFSETSEGTISCDRYCAYFCFALGSDGRFSIAYCWAYMRRDFLAVVKDWPQYESWGMDWIEEIRQLYCLNDCRRLQSKKSVAFNECHKRLEERIKAFKEKGDRQFENTQLADPCRKVLNSLNRH